MGGDIQHFGQGCPDQAHAAAGRAYVAADPRSALVTVKLVRLGGRELLFNLIRDVTELKRIQSQLRSSEERLSYALEGASDGLFDWDHSDGAPGH